MAPEQLTAHMLKTYRDLRLCLLIFAIFLPIVLVLAGFVLGHVGIQDSLSAYYWAGFDEPSEERTIFVGVLFAVGACLIAYRGFSNEEDLALNIAGVLAWGIAFFPMQCNLNIRSLHSCAGEGYAHIHGICAVTFFMLLAYVALFRSKDTLGGDTSTGQMLSARDRRWYSRQYNIAALAMLVLPVAAVIITYWIGHENFGVIAVEFAAVWAFAYYWAVKSLEMKKSQVEILAARQDVFADAMGRIKSIPDGQPTVNGGAATAQTPAADVQP
jgi:hypothetical protein